MTTSATTRAPPSSPSQQSFTTDPWTTDQEATLLKALVTYKPVGLHAHFRMLAIRNYLLQSGTIDPEAPHTRIPGIWTKLQTLYDLPRLDEREDAIFISLGSSSSTTDRTNDKSTGTSSSSYWRDFDLTGPTPTSRRTSTHDPQREEFESLMWDRRLDPNGSDSSSFEDDNDTNTNNTRSSPLPTADETPARGSRSSRRTAKGRVSRLKDEMDIDSSVVTSGSPAGSARASRRASKAASAEVEVGDGDQTMDDAGDGDGDESGGEEGSESTVGDSEEEGERRGQGVGGRRGRGVGGGRRGGRGKRGRRGRGG